MSYIPDYRKETDKLNTQDRQFIAGYRLAMEQLSYFFDNMDIYTEDSKFIEVSETLKEWFLHYADMEETEMVASVFDDADYLPEDIDLKDANKIK